MTENEPMVLGDVEEEEEEDVVVREIDVYLCGDFATTGSQLVLLQHPLRPPWRPYDYEKVKTMRMKPKAQRLEVELPIDTGGRNYTDAVEAHKKIDKIKLRSTLAESRATYALATLRDDKLLLAPIDFALHLRPHLEHMKDQPVGKHALRDDDDDTEGAAASSRAAAGEEGGGDEDEDDEQGGGGSGGIGSVAKAGPTTPALTAVEVQVQKRETERQQEARLRSYAYIQAQEDEEAWKTLALHREDSELAAKLWAKYMVPKEVDLPLDMRRAAYLRCISPATYSAANGGGFVGFGAPPPGAHTPKPVSAPHGGAVPGGASGTLPAASNTAATLPQSGSSAGPAGASGSQSGAGAAASAVAADGPDTVPQAVQAVLPAALTAVFQRSTTLSMANLRQFLLDPALSAAVGAARMAATLGDAPLHQAVLATGNVACIRRTYVQIKTGSVITDPFRAMVIDYLREHENFRRQTMLDLSLASNIPFVESTYTKVVKDICRNHGSYWLLKTGADV